MAIASWERLLHAIPICILLASISARQVHCNSDNIDETCGSEELNHSSLVECNKCLRSATEANKRDSSRSLWPTSSTETIHIQSTRDGRRFEQTHMRKLTSKVNEHTKLFDINTTLSVNSRQIASGAEIVGLGGTLDAESLATAIEDQSFERLYELIFDDLFGASSEGARMALLRLPLEASFISQHNLTSLLLELDGQVARSRNYKLDQVKLKIVIHLKRAFSDLELNKVANILSWVDTRLASVDLWALALDHDQLKKMGKHSLPKLLPSTCHLIASVAMSDAPTFIQWSEANGIDSLQGLLIGSEVSVAYDVLDYLVEHTSQDFKLIIIGRPRPKTELRGDWFNAHEFAIEILNHLKHGANGFIEDSSIVHLQADKPELTNYDCSIYSLIQSHKTHFKGPMFFATGHFSRYLTASRSLVHELFTQPNMFSAHYSAFMTLDKKHIVSVVLNGNEHKLMFSWVIDDTIVTNVILEPKSFNTFVMKA